jgi:hypothetical protein
MKRILRFFWLSAVLLCVTPPEMNGQKPHTVIIKDDTLIAPKSFTVKFSVPRRSIIPVEDDRYLFSTDSILQLLSSNDSVTILDQPSQSSHLSADELFDILYARVDGAAALKALKAELGSGALFTIEDYYVPNLDESEKTLTATMLNEARLVANQELAGSGEAVGRIIKFEEVVKPDNHQDNDTPKDSSGGFAILRKHKFIYATFQGHTVTKGGYILLEKRLRVFFEKVVDQD